MGTNKTLDKNYFPKTPIHLTSGFRFILVTHVYKISVLRHSVLQKLISSLGAALLLCVKFPIAEREVWNIFVNGTGILKNMYQRRGWVKKKKRLQWSFLYTVLINCLGLPFSCFSQKYPKYPY